MPTASRPMSSAEAAAPSVGEAWRRAERGVARRRRRRRIARRGRGHPCLVRACGPSSPRWRGDVPLCPAARCRGEEASVAAVTEAPTQDLRREVGRVGLALGALGVVYGDLLTSPLYSLREAFDNPHHP